MRRIGKEENEGLNGEAKGKEREDRVGEERRRAEEGRRRGKERKVSLPQQFSTVGAYGACKPAGHSATGPALHGKRRSTDYRYKQLYFRPKKQLLFNLIIGFDLEKS